MTKDPETIAAMIPKKLTFLDDEIAGARARMNGEGNSVQQGKLQNLREIREILVYLKAAIERRRAA